MARNKKTINIRKEQLQEVMLAGQVDSGENLNKAAKDTLRNAQTDGLSPNKIDGVSFTRDQIIKCGKSFTKKQVVENRKKYLEENSVVYNKKDLFRILNK
jgi:hypothetical protein